MDSDLLLRLEHLEAQLRRWKLFSLIAVALLSILLFAGASYGRSDLQQDPAARLVSRSFVLVGEDGNVYARLGTKNGEPVFQFYDQAGNVVWSAPPKAEIKGVHP